MATEASGPHHFMRRKIFGIEAYPHPEKIKRWMDRLAYLVTILGPLLTIPQIIKIYYYQNAAGVSVISWATYLLCSVVWFHYGLLHRQKAIVLANGIYIFLNTFILYGAIIHGQGWL